MSRQPLGLTVDMAKYVVMQKLRGRRRFPMVLMLEPTEMCNLTCTGCGKIRQSPEVLNKRLTVEECLAAVDECGAPAVSIAGGEPLVHPEIVEIVKGILARRKLTLLCTNGILLGRVLDKLDPDPRFTFVFHLDGPREHHDRMVERPGVFDIVMKGIRAAKERGFRVATNTTLYKGADTKAIGQLLRELCDMGVDNCILSPAFTYEEVDPANRGIFLRRNEARRMVREIVAEAGPRVRFYNTPIFLDFLMGKKELRCTPWGNPTRDPKGWKGPCYLLTDRHYDSFAEMMADTRWEEFGYGENPRCASCMMHSGYEASAVAQMSLRDAWRMVRWMFAS
ncbi:hopanoid biosynthesis associated radical SAM protein HpnH [Alicyclobacillus cellulosilyticus]|uniref:Hopanoid biosynthesis associated radical SAM protein HpnH n=1 Tax=Alicyclobacillus cellulosilyticus TaxID=1003997 RepID=A0A917K2G6_9BACL|nr:adenosyl-hopene transferase HpnH [Alicyclobacillus cellulosilyticus]GGI98310.1 hopanoid biosynthesis associated radical SAM protein HpnH [Alicyclobacillus cellulosilyticus]